MRHPLSGSVYGIDEDGLVRVVKGDSYGRFDAIGRWVEGDIRYADPQLCQWIGGSQLEGDAMMSMFS